jgi:D-glycerate 3-kinase
LPLALSFFQALRDGTPTKIPQFDKSAYGGQGDRVPASQWEEVNGPSQRKVKVIIFEGWSVGFRPLSENEVAQKQLSSKPDPSSTLPKNRLEDLLFVNERLKGYDGLTNMLHAFMHIDAEETKYVYEWRLEQEVQLRREKGSGMTDEQVRAFVDGYYPAYELYTDELRKGVFKGPEDKGKQMRLIVGRDRRVKEVILI